MSNEELVTAIQQGQEELREELVLQTLPFALWIARRYAWMAERNRGFDMEDLKQSAVLGLLTAIPYWREDMGAKFLTVAGWFCHREIRNLIGSKKRLENSRDILSLQSPLIGNDGADTETELLETVQDETSPNPITLMEEAERSLMLEEAIQELPEELGEALKDRWFRGTVHGRMDAESRGRLRKGMRLLMKSEKLWALWDAYTSAPYNHAGGVSAFQSGKPYTSSTEWAVLRREKLRKAMSKQVNTL